MMLSSPIKKKKKKHTKYCQRAFPGDPGVKNLPSNAGDVGLIPGQGTKIPHAAGQLKPVCLKYCAHAP